MTLGQVAGARPIDVLFVMKSKGGGAVISLLLLIKNLDRERVRATVLFYGTSPYDKEFRAAGARVLTLDSTISTRSMAAFLPDGVAARRGNWQWLRAVRRLNGFVQKDLRLARRIVQVVEQLRPDIVQSNICPSADRASILATGLARVPHVSYSQYWTAYEPWLDRPLSVFVDRYLFVSEAVRDRLLTASNLPHEKTRVVYTPFEFPPSRASSAAERVQDSLGIKGRRPLVANIGRIVPWKGQDVFLRAFASVTRAYPQAVALVVGSPGESPSGQAYEARLRLLARELGIAEQVVFTGHREDVEDIICASDVVVHSSSQAEPLGRVVMEAIALETPVIATGAGGVPEMVEDGDTGWLVPPGNAEAMAGAITSIIGKPGRAAEMATKARRAAEHRFSAQTFVRILESEYRRILSG